MTDSTAGKQPTQAMGKDHGGSNDGVEAPGGKSASESSGGAYPNPHTGKDAKNRDDVGGGFLGHGGQSGMDYSGTGDGDTDDDVGNENAVTK